jgi:hypothetical protein
MSRHILGSETLTYREMKTLRRAALRKGKFSVRVKHSLSRFLCVKLSLGLEGGDAQDAFSLRSLSGTVLVRLQAILITYANHSIP